MISLYVMRFRILESSFISNGSRRLKSKKLTIIWKISKKIFRIFHEKHSEIKVRLLPFFVFNSVFLSSAVYIFFWLLNLNIYFVGENLYLMHFYGSYIGYRFGLYFFRLLQKRYAYVYQCPPMKVTKEKTNSRWSYSDSYLHRELTSKLSCLL